LSGISDTPAPTNYNPNFKIIEHTVAMYNSFDLEEWRLLKGKSIFILKITLDLGHFLLKNNLQLVLTTILNQYFPKQREIIHLMTRNHFQVVFFILLSWILCKGIYFCLKFEKTERIFIEEQKLTKDINDTWSWFVLKYIIKIQIQKSYRPKATKS
jgi:hypothetical protein